MPKKKQPPARAKSQNTAVPKVVIVGANFAGLSAARKLAGCTDSLEVTLVDPSESFHWTPNIHEIVSGLKSPASIAISSAQISARRGHNFIAQRVVHIDGENNQLTLDQDRQLSYDALLLACGQVNAGMKTPGVAEHCLGVRRAEQAQQLQQRVAARLARGKPMHITIIGGGFTGVEVLGELLRRYRNSSGLAITVIDSAPQLLPGMPVVISTDLQQQCASLPVSFYLKRKIKRVNKDAVLLEDGERIASDLTLWCVGTTTPQLIVNSKLPHTGDGLKVNDTLQCSQIENLFAAGDIAATSPPYKKQASIAIDMGELAGTNIRRYLKGEALEPFNPMQKPLLLSFGDINTYFIYNNSVFASPLLASLKEAVYQFYMAKFSATLPPAKQGLGIAGRYTRSVKKLFLPELLQFRFAETIARSRKLQ